MPLWHILIRSAVHSFPAGRFSVRPRCQLQWHSWHNVRPQKRSYTNALAERQHDDKESWVPAQAASSQELDSKSLGDSSYLDFVLEGYEQPSPGHPSRKDARRARGTANVRQRSALTHGERARLKARRVAAAATGARRLPMAHKHIKSDLRTSAVFSSVWNVRYARVTRRYDQGLPEYYLEPAAAIPFSYDAFRRIEAVLDRMESAPNGSVISVKGVAYEHYKLEREVWSEVALWLLCYDKVKLMDFLLATHAPLYPPINWVEECLQMLVRHYTVLDIIEETRVKRFRQLIQLFLVLLDRETKEQYVFSGGFVRQLLPYCTDEQVNEIWASIKLEKVKVHSNTILHFAHYFGKHDQFERSLDALLAAKDAGARLDSIAFRSGCSTLLRKSSADPGGFRVCLRLVEHLVSLGVYLDTRLYNIIMLNAVEAGDLETLNNIYRSMLEQDVKPDTYTCAIRLKACKLRIDDAGMLKEIVQDTIQYANVRTEVLVCGEILHCLALHHSKHNPETAFSTLAAAYMQFFDPSPLERLGLTLPLAPPIPRHESSTQRMQPSRHVLLYMISAYLDHNASSTEAADLYTRYRQLVESGDETIANSATTSHLSNVFLHRFTRSKTTLLQAAQVVKDMQKPLPASANITQAEPDTYTWSIFLHGFSARGETKLAEQVLAYMRSKGLEPNYVTWTSLVGGYARDQDAEGLVDVVRRVERSGFAWDEWMRRGVSRFRDKQRLRHLLERQRFEQNMDFTRDIKGRLGERLSGADDDAVADRMGSSVRRVERGRAMRAKEGFADSSAELAELAGGVVTT